MDDDLGSGWLQVKKKHRSNSKCLPQRAGGSLCENQKSSAHPHYFTNNDRESRQSRQQCTGKDIEIVTPDSPTTGVLCSSLNQQAKPKECSENLTNVISAQCMPVEMEVEVDKSMALSIEETVKYEFCDSCSFSNSTVDEYCKNGDFFMSNSSLLSTMRSTHANKMADSTLSENLETRGEPISHSNADENSDMKLTQPASLSDLHKLSGLNELSASDNLNSRDSVMKFEEETDSNSAVTICAGSCTPSSDVIHLENTLAESAFGSVIIPGCAVELPSGTKVPDRSEPVIANNGAVEMATAISGAPAVSTEFGESAESKERFRQRLWCFLFENLNRAIDELYLLCELECDMEQMDEAMLVLEEAKSDFQELKSRAEHFDSSKKNSSLPKDDGISMAMKADHRRPHALSWEVRRMTTSAHKAEILSSSLEAFKKIQSEIARSIDNLIVPNSHPEAVGMPLRSSSSSLFAEDRKINADYESTELPEMNGAKDHEAEQATGSAKPGRTSAIQNGRLPLQAMSSSGKYRKGYVAPTMDFDKCASKRDSISSNDKLDRVKLPGTYGRNPTTKEKEVEKDKKNAMMWKSMDAWKEKRNWEDILKSPLRSSHIVHHPPGNCRKATERARVLHDKLMSPEKKRRTAIDMKKEAEEKHARARRIRSQLENERVQRLQRTSEKLSRVNEWQAVRSSKMREVINARHQRGESRHEAYLAQVARRAGDETIKVNEVRFITSLNEENKKLILRQKLHDSEVRRAEKLQVIRTKQKEDIAREEAVLERRKLLEAEKLQRLADTQRKKEEAQVRREEERKASSAAREAKAAEQLRRKEMRAKARQEEAELLAQKLAEKLRESEQRRKYYLEQIREKASMDFRDQSSPFQRRFLSKDGQGRSVSTNNCEDYQSSGSVTGEAATKSAIVTNQHSLKRRIKRIRQRLMALKHEYIEPPISSENLGIAYRAAVGAAKAKVSKWLQDLQRLRQARKEGASAIGLVITDIIKYLEGKELELHAARQAGMLDFIASALPASHSSKPEPGQVTVFLLRLLRVLLSEQANRSYFLSQNLLPPIIPMLSASLENYIRAAASCTPGTLNLSSKSLAENMESFAEVLDGFLWAVTIIIGHYCQENKQLQMQDGLIELVVDYQVIQHLRDLFALYERPQLEGSPFPPIILSGLNLLAVLTSRPVNFSNIDWLSSKCETLQSNLVLEFGRVDSADMELNANPLVFEPSGDKLPPTQQSSDKSNDSVCSQVVTDVKVLSGLSHSNVLCNSPSAVVVSGDLLSSGDSLVASELGQTHTAACGTSLLNLDENAAAAHQNVGNFKEDVQQGKMGINNSEKSNDLKSKQPLTLVLTAIAETSLVRIPSILTAVLLQTNNKISSEQVASVLPSNFEEVAAGVLKVLNNIACLDIVLLQSMLARSDLKMEFFHLISFLFTHCANKWNGANDQVGLLLIELLSLLAYFSLFNPGNQAVLRWGKSPTILHKVCDLPFELFSDPKLMPLLASALLASCYGCNQNKYVVQQELSSEMLLPLLKSCRPSMSLSSSDSLPLDIPMTNLPTEGEGLAKPVRRSTRPSMPKSGLQGGLRFNKSKPQKDCKVSRTSDECTPKQTAEALHLKFPSFFLDKVEEFFCSEA